MQFLKTKSFLIIISIYSIKLPSDGKFAIKVVSNSYDADNFLSPFSDSMNILPLRYSEHLCTS